MITQELKDKLSKVYELVKRGSEGEKQAAEAAMSRIIEKYNLQGIDLESLDKKTYYFTYTDNLETKLFCMIINIMLEKPTDVYKLNYMGKAVKKLHCDLTYLDYITVDSAYSYFRTHMRKQWKEACLVHIKRKRSTKTQNKAREQLQDVFISRYCIASGLYKEEHLQPVDKSSLSKAEIDAYRAVRDVQGGSFHKQVTNGLALNERN